MNKQVNDGYGDDDHGDGGGDAGGDGWEAPVQLPRCQRPPAPAKNWSGDESKLKQVKSNVK